MIDFLVQMTGRVGFEQVEAYDRQGCYSAQSVQYVVMRLGVGEGSGGNFRLRHGFRVVRVRSFVLASCEHGRLGDVGRVPVLSVLQSENRCSGELYRP